MNSSIWFFPLSALINGVTSFILAVYLSFSLRYNRMSRYLFYLCVVAVFWSIPYFFWQISTDPLSAIFWSKLLMIGAIFTSISYLHLVIVFLNLDKEKFYRFVLAAFYLFTLVWLAAVFSPYFIDGVEPRSYFKFWPIAGPLYLPYLIAFSFEFIYASFLLYKKYKKSFGIDRLQTALMLFGILIGFIGGSTNYPLWFGLNIAPWGNILASVYVVMTVYAMMRYKFLNIKVISTELFTGILFIIFLVDLFLSKNAVEFILRAAAVCVMGFFGIMLIRSVHKEIKRREEITNLAHSLEKANLRLQELDRQKTEFLSIASHQLRTPLSILKGYIELIKDGGFGKPTKGIVKTLDDMDESNEHLIKLVDEFLDISRIEQGRTKFVFASGNIGDVVEGIKRELQPRAKEKGLDVVYKKDDEILSVEMDAEKIRHVVFNFVDNAIKYSDKGKVVISTERENDGITVRVRDQGLGFNKVDEANFFQKFYRGENVKGNNVNGTGLGLYVCRKFIENHNGKVWAHSSGLGRGGEFGFWIPLKMPKN